MKCRLSSILFRIFLLLYLAVVAFLCFADFNGMPDIQKTFLGIPTDKIVHFCMFFPMPVIGYMAYGGEKKTIGKILVAVLNSCVFCCIFAGITELVQASLPYRSEDLNDFAADCIAICCSSLLTFIFACISTKRERRRT